MKKKLALFLVLALIVSMFVGCGGEAAEETKANEQEVSNVAEDPTEEEAVVLEGDAFDEFPRPNITDKPHIGVLQVNLSSESCQRNQNQFEIECAHRGWELTTIYYETEDNWRDSFLELLNQGVDAIVCTIVNSASSKAELFKQAREQGVGVYFVDGGTCDGVICDSTMANSVAAMELFYKIGSDYNWDLNVAVIDNGPMFVAQCRTVPVRSVLDTVYTNMHELAYEDISAAAAQVGSMLGAQDTVKAWLQQYGDEVECIFSYGDNSAMGAAEVIMANGDEHGDKTFTAGIDGGKQVWSYIRDNTPVKYSYAQPFELYVHNVMELIDQLQVQGMNPGDSGCLIPYSGAVIYASGTVITRDNVPAVGTVINEAFDYYDPSITDAWYMWEDGPGRYIVEAYEG